MLEIQNKKILSSLQVELVRSKRNGEITEEAFLKVALERVKEK